MEKLSPQKIISGDRRELSKAITLIEDSRKDSRPMALKLLEELLPHSGQSLRMAVTGIPGAGKSTFIESLGLYLIAHGKKVAVLAIDPSGPKSGGSILGDKTRMNQLALSDNAYIRPSPTLGHMGGVGLHTAETIVLCEAAGFDVVLIETVGVGQSEFEASLNTDLTLLLTVPNTGDELQGIKKGLMEMADLIAINKADGDNREAAQLAKHQIVNAKEISTHAIGHDDIMLISSLHSEGIEELWQKIELKFKKINIKKVRQEQKMNRFQQVLIQEIQREILSNKKFQKIMQNEEALIKDNKSSIYKSVAAILGSLELEIK